MEETVNPEGNESQPTQDNIEAAFASYLDGQAGEPEQSKEQPKEGAEAGQPEAAKPEDDGQVEQLFKVKVNGEEREIPLAELVKGYQLESDYRVKTSQLAEQSRAAQEKHQQAMQLQDHYAQQLQAYQQQLQAMQPQPPDPSTINSDPVAFLRQQQAYQAWQAQVQQVAAERGQLDEQRQAVNRQAQEEALRREAELLFSAIPDWSDAEKAKGEKAALAQYLQDAAGYSKEEIAQAVDHRAIVIARKAMLFDQMMSKQKSATEKVASLPPKAPQRPGPGNVSATDGRTRHMQALKKSGSIDDAANAFAAYLGS